MCAVTTWPGWTPRSCAHAADLNARSTRTRTEPDAAVVVIGAGAELDAAVVARAAISLHGSSVALKVIQDLVNTPRPNPARAVAEMPPHLFRCIEHEAVDGRDIRVGGVGEVHFVQNVAAVRFAVKIALDRGAKRMRERVRWHVDLQPRAPLRWSNMKPAQPLPRLFLRVCDRVGIAHRHNGKAPYAQPPEYPKLGHRTVLQIDSIVVQLCTKNIPGHRACENGPGHVSEKTENRPASPEREPRGLDEVCD